MKKYKYFTFFICAMQVVWGSGASGQSLQSSLQQPAFVAVCKFLVQQNNANAVFLHIQELGGVCVYGPVNNANKWIGLDTSNKEVQFLLRQYEQNKVILRGFVPQAPLDTHFFIVDTAGYFTNVTDYLLDSCTFQLSRFAVKGNNFLRVLEVERRQDVDIILVNSKDRKDLNYIYFKKQHGKIIETGSVGYSYCGDLGSENQRIHDRYER